MPIVPDQDWYAARIPSEHLFELLRTPGFHSWQEEGWLFCCQQPMTYIGGWRSVMESLRPDDPRGLFDSDDELKEWVWEGVGSGRVCLYVYRCKSCGRFRATWDTD